MALEINEMKVRQIKAAMGDDPHGQMPLIAINVEEAPYGTSRIDLVTNQASYYDIGKMLFWTLLKTDQNENSAELKQGIQDAMKQFAQARSKED